MLAQMKIHNGRLILIEQPEEMKRIRILLFYGLSKEPVIEIDCWENELKMFLANQDRDIYRIEIIEL